MQSRTHAAAPPAVHTLGHDPGAFPQSPESATRTLEDRAPAQLLQQQELCPGKEYFVRQSQVGPGERGLAWGTGSRFLCPHFSSPPRVSCNRSDYPLRGRRWPLQRCLLGGREPLLYISCSLGMMQAPIPCSQVWDGVAEVHMALNNQATGLLVGRQRAMVGMMAMRASGYGTVMGRRTGSTSSVS